MKQEIVAMSQIGLHRFLVVEKTTLGKLDDMYAKHGYMLRDVPGSYTMLFHREPDETPLQETVKREAFML